MSAPARYATPFRWIHWIMALIILTMLIFGQGFAREIPDAQRTMSLAAHSSLGTLVVILLTIRILFRLSGRSNRPEHDLPPLLSLASKSVQAGIYLLMIYLPVTGFLAARAHDLPVTPFGLSSISTADTSAYEALRPWHEFGTKAMMILLVLHIGAALMHRFILKDGVMGSMSLFRQKS